MFALLEGKWIDSQDYNEIDSRSTAYQTSLKFAPRTAMHQNHGCILNLSERN
jgi:chromosome segregation and condensation protein ScpB